MKFSLRSLLLCVVVSAGLVVLLIKAGEPPGGTHKTQLIIKGLQKSDVREIMGEPQEVSEECWVYRSNWRTGWTQVVFDDDGLVAYVDAEGMW
ncbi:outer membrane protein assembly factor BamE [Stieleria varia]|uniref:Lipoprotein SmpA/OmlA domain-containing protein n=1 Tax=Stieleria varia TaxID=2528005 RepID=A0A5C6AWX7_9BACT|nr:outer membrane protein assembly factor BamE [Stieleria varia]TWU04443.1 hypothetical protein Pla52n_24840 [Stieleria varia]